MSISEYPMRAQVSECYTGWIIDHSNAYLIRYRLVYHELNRNIKIRAQLRILKSIAIVKEASRKVLKHVY